MKSSLHDAVSMSHEKVENCRRQNDSEALASALETYARALLQSGDIAGAAAALEEAGTIWVQLNHVREAGSCLLLASSSYRLALQPIAARRTLEIGLEIELPEKLHDGFEVEACEQLLANGHSEDAWQGFSRFLDHRAAKLDHAIRAQILQRRATAALECKKFHEGATDLLEASQIYLDGRQHKDAEACALAAAGVLAEVDVAAAERIVLEVAKRVPIDGASAARRGLIGGRVAMQADAYELAANRFDEARQGALDVCDPVTYVIAAIEAADAAEAAGLRERTYTTLATGMATLSDLLGRDAAREAFEPKLRTYLNRWGNDEFNRVKTLYESRQRARRDQTKR